jgi:hypothetical protein
LLFPAIENLKVTIVSKYQAMELDPTKNDNLHTYIWDKLLKRIATESAL